MRREEASLGKPIIGNARHKLFYEKLSESAVVAEKVKYNRGLSAAGTVAKAATANDAGGAKSDGGGKNKNRKLGRANKTKTTTDDHEGVAATAHKAAPPAESP